MSRLGATLLALGTLVLVLAPVFSGGPPPVSRAPGIGQGRAFLGVPSAAAFAAPPAALATPPVARPAAPTLSVDGAAPSAIALSWVASGGGGFVNYSVASSTVGPSGPWQVDGVLTTQSTTSWSTGSLAPGVGLWWQVTENTCVIFCGSSTSNVVGYVQPTLAALNFTLPSGSSANFNWTNNATYGGLLGFVSYGLYERVSGGAPNLVASISTVATHSFTVTGLSGGLGYTFYLNTTDCYSACGTGSAVLAVGSSNAVTFGVPVALSASVSDVRAVVDTGQSDLFSCNPSGGRAPYTFAWDFGNGTSLPGPASEGQSYASAGSPTIHCVVTDAASTQATSATTITVNPAPVLNLTANATGVDIGQPLGLTGTASLGTPEISVAWAFGDGQTGSGTTVTHSYATTGRSTITCSATDATTTTVVRTLAVNVSPRVAVSSSASSSTAAPGTTLTFLATAHNGSGTFSRYAWTFGDGAKAVGSSASHAFPAVGAFNATVLVTDSNGAANSSTVRIFVSAIAVQASMTPASGTTRNPFTFVVGVTGGAGGPYNVTWSFGDGTKGYGATATHRYTSAATFQATVVVTDRLGATNTTALPSLTVGSPPAAPPLVPYWVIALMALAIAFLVGFFLVRRYRRQQSAALRSAAPWAPPTDPSRTLRGRKNCPTCGASNLPIRETCENCGADLPRRPVRS